MTSLKMLETCLGNLMLGRWRFGVEFRAGVSSSFNGMARPSLQYLSLHMCVYIYIQIYINTYIHIHVYIYIYAYMFVNVYVYTYTCT